MQAAGGGCCAKTVHDLRQAQLSLHCVSSFSPFSEFPVDAAVSDTRNSSLISLLRGDMSVAEADEM